MSSFRFIHTADLHLDSPLRSLALKNEALADLLHSASRTALEKIVSQALERRVDALVIAGDLFDGEVRSVKSAAFCASQFRRLGEADIPVCLIRGNHDAESTISNAVPMPDNVHSLNQRSCTRVFNGVAIHGIGFTRKHVPDSLLPRYPLPRDDCLNIGIMHTSLNGSAGHDLYAPCSVAELAEFGYEYWALGHIHKRQVWHEYPHIVMPGIPQGRDIGESGPKSATLVESGDYRMELSELPTAAVQFQNLELPVPPACSWNDLHDQIVLTLGHERARHDTQHLVIRLVFSGDTTLNWQIRNQLDLLDEIALAEAEQLDGVWIDKLVDRTRPVSSHAADDPVLELHSFMRNLVDDDSFLREADEERQRMLRSLPAVLSRQLKGDSRESELTLLKELVKEGIDDVAAAIHSGRASQ